MKTCSVSVFIVKIVPQQTRWVPCVWWVLVLFCWSRFLQLGGAKGSVNRGCQNPYIIASDSELPPGFDQHIVDYFTNSDWSNKNSLLLADDFGLVHPPTIQFFLKIIIPETNSEFTPGNLMLGRWNFLFLGSRPSFQGDFAASFREGMFQVGSKYDSIHSRHDEWTFWKTTPLHRIHWASICGWLWLWIIDHT